MAKLTDYAKTAATEYWQDTGRSELDPHWAAEFFQDSGVQDDYPRQDIIAFHAMVQKELTEMTERAAKQAHLQLDKITRSARPPRKP